MVEDSAGPDARTPRWVKVFGGISLVVVVIFLFLLIAGGGRHGPGRHLRPSTGAPETSGR
jgi:hypothetical protein